jgi:circadian clock protein KaiB
VNPTPPPWDTDAELGDTERYVLTLFISGMTPRSIAALAMVRDVCDARLGDRHDLEVVDVYQRPDLASRHQVVAVPTLLKSAPGPERRLVGDLSDRARVLRGLGLRPDA